VSVPLSAIWYPKKQDVDTALEALADKSLRPIFVHCEHGRDRTGMIIGLYRVFHEKWKAEDAWSEMLARGFRSMLVSLTRYFSLQTGLSWFGEAEFAPGL
jgi:protein tyrosine/serine phosphatase